MHQHHHDVASPVSAAGRHRSRLTVAFVLVVGYFVVELAVALATGSLALLSDAGHLLTDGVGLGLALGAVVIAERGPDVRRSFGWYRLEVLAALVNAVLLLGLATWVITEAIGRLQGPPEVAAGPVLVVALVGLAVNIIAFVLLRSGARESLNLRGAYLEVLADALSSLGVIAAAAVMLVTGWPYADPLVALGIGAIIVPRAWHLGRQAIGVLLQAVPEDADPEQIARDLSALDGVADVHDLHLWTLTSGMDVATAHLLLHEGAEPRTVLAAASRLLRDVHRIEHATVQVEPSDHVGCERIGW